MLLYWTNNSFNPVKASKLRLRVFALGGLAALPCAPTVSCSLQLHRAESGSLTCLIAFDSSLSSPVDQWSSALFIRNINVPHIPTGSATTHEPSQRVRLYFVILRRSFLTFVWHFIILTWRILWEYGERGMPCLFVINWYLTYEY